MAFSSTFEIYKEETLILAIKWNLLRSFRDGCGKTFLQLLAQEALDLLSPLGGRLLSSFGSQWSFLFPLSSSNSSIFSCLSGALNLQNLAFKKDLAFQMVIFLTKTCQTKGIQEVPATGLMVLERGRELLQTIPIGMIGVEAKIAQEGKRKFLFIEEGSWFFLRSKRLDPSTLGHEHWLLQRPGWNAWLKSLEELSSGAIKGILLEGNRGVGKTYILYKIAKLAESLGAKIQPIFEEKDAKEKHSLLSLIQQKGPSFFHSPSFFGTSKKANPSSWHILLIDNIHLFQKEDIQKFIDGLSQAPHCSFLGTSLPHSIWEDKNIRKIYLQPWSKSAFLEILKEKCEKHHIPQKLARKIYSLSLRNMRLALVLIHEWHRNPTCSYHLLSLEGKGILEKIWQNLPQNIQKTLLPLSCFGPRFPLQMVDFYLDQEGDGETQQILSLLISNHKILGKKKELLFFRSSLFQDFLLNKILLPYRQKIHKKILSLIQKASFVVPWEFEVYHLSCYGLRKEGIRRICKEMEKKSKEHLLKVYWIIEKGKELMEGYLPEEKIFLEEYQTRLRKGE